MYVRRQFNGNSFTRDCNLFQDQYRNLKRFCSVSTFSVGGLPILTLLFYFKEGNRRFVFISDEIEI